MGRFLNADAFVSSAQGVLGFNMFAYCVNNPMNYSDESGTWPDSYAGLIGEELGKLIYELLTGKTHPAEKYEDYTNHIIQTQSQIVQGVTQSGLDSRSHQIQLQVESQYKQDMTVLAIAEYYVENPQKAIDHGFAFVGICGLYCSYVGSAGITTPASIKVTIHVLEVLGTLWGAYRAIEELHIDIWKENVE